VDDARWQFPDDESAAAFLNTAEAELATVSLGYEPAPVPSGLPPGSRAYALSDVILGVGDVGHTILIPLGTLVADVDVTGPTQMLTDELAADIARAAGARMTAALAGEPPPSFVPPPPPLNERAAVDALTGHVPDALRPSCRTLDEADGRTRRGGELARLACAPDPDVEVTYRLFTTTEDLEAAFADAEEVARVFGTLPPDGACPGQRPDGAWVEDGVEVGRVLCYTRDEAAVVVGAHRPSLVLAELRDSTGGLDPAWDAWVLVRPR
jgi:hypothetical protein